MRNKYYDRLKGFAIILVVIGHSIQSTYGNYDDITLFRYIYSFHMPLFMYISGMVLYRPINNIDFIWLKKRFKSLVYPFLSWMIIPYIFSSRWNEFPQYVKNVILSPDYALWFLWVLFINSAILFIIVQVGKKFSCIKDEIIAMVIVICLTFASLFCRYLGVPLVAWHIVFFLCGYYTGKYKERLLKYKWVLGIAGTIAWICLVPYWSRVDSPYFYKNLAHIFDPYSLKILLLIYKYTIPLSGIIFSLLVIYIFKNLKVFCWLEYFGKRTIEIYVLQWYFFSIVSVENNNLKVLLKIIVGLVLPCMISELCYRSDIGLLLFGKKAIAKN